MKSWSISTEMLIAGLLSSFFAYQYVIRILPSILVYYLPLRYGINISQFSNFAGIYYVAYSISHIPIGIMLDRFGLRNVVSASAALIGFSLLACISFDTWNTLFMSRIIAGVLSSAAILGCFKALSGMFDQKTFNMSLGILISVGLSFVSTANFFVSNLSLEKGFDALTIYLGIVGVALSFVLFLIIPTQKKLESMNDVCSKEATHNSYINITNIFQILKDKQILTLFFVNGLMIGTMEGFMDAWGGVFVKFKISGSLNEAGVVATIMLFGHVVGALVAGFLGERYASYITLIKSYAFVLFVLLLSLFMFLLVS